MTWFAIVTSAVFLLWYRRLVHQTERALKQKFGDTYPRGGTRPPFLVPNPFLWRRPNGRFSFRRVLSREHNDFYFVVAGFVGLELACDLLGEQLAFRQWLKEDLHWALLLGIGTLLYVAFRARREAIAATGTGPVPADVVGPITRGIRVDGRVRSVDVLENLISFGHLQRILDATLDAAALSPGDRLLDVGCGTGKLAIQAASLVGGRVKALGIDATAGMIDSRGRMRARRDRARSFRRASAKHFPFGRVGRRGTSSYFLHHLHPT